MDVRTNKLLIIGSTQGIYGGIEAFMIVLAEAASNWPELEVKLCFKLVKGAKLSEQLLQIAVGACPQVSFIQRGSLELFKLVAWADTLHVQNTPPDVVIIARLLSKKIFLTVHNRYISSLGLHSVLWRVCIKLAHQRWFNSQFVWKTWEPNEKSSTSSCIPTVCRLPNSWCPPSNRRGFLFIGRWIPNKGIQELIRAYALCNFNVEEWPLTLLGDGPLKQEVINLVQEIGLKGVNMPGFVNDKIKEEYLSSSRWLIAPARTLEDLGLTPIEARSVGVPSIVTRDGGLTEAGGPAALIAEPSNIEDLAQCMQVAATMNESEYEQRGELCRNSLANYLKPMSFYRKAYATVY